MPKPKFAFFGTPRFATVVLDELAAAGYTPELIVTALDAKVGRGLTLTPPPVKVWADAHGVRVIQPTSLKVTPPELEGAWDFFVVAAYGKLLRANIINVPARGVLNVHPSLLPKLRGASPIESAILTDAKETGVTIMQIDEEMDHGPVYMQKKIELPGWPPRASELETILAHEGGKLLAQVMTDILVKGITPTPQDHANATFTKMLSKEDGLLDLSADPYQNFLKIRALEGWPGTYFFAERGGKKVRVKITEAAFEDEALTILKVIPEGKREMSYEDFQRA